MRISPAAPLAALKTRTPRDSQIDGKLRKKLNRFNSKTQFPHKVKTALLITHLLIPKARPKSRAHLCVRSSGRMAKPGRERKMSFAGSSCGSRFPGSSLPALVPGLSATPLAPPHTFCASRRGGRASSVYREPGSARLAGAAAGRGRAGLAGGIWPSPGAALLGHWRASPERRSRVQGP